MKFNEYLIHYQELILLSIFGLSVIVQLFFYLGIYSKFVFHRRSKVTLSFDPVSVIICARNEAENLEKNLLPVLTQDYPEFEVIVVNDSSNDRTDEVLGNYLKKYKNLRTTSIVEDKKFTHGKKLAVTIGIKAAKHELLIFTDADCQPVSDQWLRKMQQHFTGDNSFVLGYGGYLRRKGLLNNYIRYDTLIIAIQYFSYALAGMPYMGVGRNLAYRKSLFFAKKGFGRHYYLLSGDDDLFVNENATRNNTAVEFSHPSHTRSEPESTLKGWIKQKKRHITTSTYYKPRHKFMLGLEYLSRLLFYFSFTWLAVLQVRPEVIYPVFGLRLIIQAVFTKKAMHHLKEKNLLLSSLFFDIFSLLVSLGLFISSTFRIKRKKWK